MQLESRRAITTESGFTALLVNLVLEENDVLILECFFYSFPSLSSMGAFQMDANEL